MKKFKFTQDMKSKLSGILPANNDYTVDFTPVALFEGFPEEIIPTFKLKPFSQKQFKDFANIGDDDNKALAALSRQIAGWSNLYNLSTEEEIIYEEDETYRLNIVSTLSPKLTIAILNELSRISGVL